MWRTTFISGIMALVGMVSCAIASSVEAVYDRELPTEGIESFELNNTNGNVQILPGGGFIIKIRAIKRVTGPTRSECESLLAKLQVETTQLGSNVEITHSSFTTTDYNELIDYTVYLPSKIDVKVVLANGDITCKDRNAEGDFETTDGNINLVNYTGAVQAKSENGGINVDCATSDARFVSTNGRLNLTVSLAENGTLKAESTNGTVHLDLPGNTSARLTAETTNGSVSAGSFDSYLAMNKHRNFASGRLGNGSGNVELSSVNGSISINSFGSDVAYANTQPTVVETRYVQVVETPCYPVYRPICRWPSPIVFFDFGFHHRWGHDRFDNSWNRHVEYRHVNAYHSRWDHRGHR